MWPSYMSEHLIGNIKDKEIHTLKQNMVEFNVRVLLTDYQE